MKKTILLSSMIMLSPFSFSETETEQYCIYADKKYSIGSIVEMSDTKRECGFIFVPYVVDDAGNTVPNKKAPDEKPRWVSAK